MLDKFRTLLGNTLIYGLGNYGIKIIGFLLIPLYTRFLTPSDYGVMALVSMYAQVMFVLMNLGQSFSLFRFLPALHAYLLKEVLISCRFPYIFAPAGAGAMPPDWMFAKQTGFLSLEPTVGMLIGVPCVLFGGVAVWTAARLHWRSSRNAPGSAIDSRERLYLWLVTACLATTLLAGVPALGMQFSTMRFLADFTSAALVLAAIGFWTLSSGLKSAGRRRAVFAAGALLGLYTIVFSILIGFQGGYYHSFERVNPALHRQLEKRLSLCE